MDAPKIELAKPARFTLSAVLAIYACSFLPVIPWVALLLLLTLKPLGIFAYIVPVLLAIATVLFSPFFGNLCVKYLAKKASPESIAEGETFIVQLTCWPRLCSGFRAVIDDADDIGWLTLTPSALVFQGDSVKLYVPYERISELEPHNVGVRGAFALRRRIAIGVKGLPDLEGIELAERSSRMLPESARVTRRIYELLI